MWLFSKSRSRAPSLMPQRGDDGLAGDVEKLRKENLELREKVLTLRETDLLTLKEELSKLKLHFRVIMALVAVAVTVAGGFGLKQYQDLQGLIRNSFKEQIDKSFTYYDKLMRARVLSGDGKFKAAEPFFRELWDLKPDDELVFFGLISCLIEEQDLDEACRVVEKAESAGMFPRKCQEVLSFNNAGFAFLARDIDQPLKLDKALRLLKRAEELGKSDNDPDVLYPLFNLALYHVATGNLSQARAYAARWRELDNSPWPEPVKLLWYQRLVASRPEASAQMKEIFAPIAESPASATPTPASSSSTIP